MSHQSRRAGSPSVQRDAAEFEEAVAKRFRLLSKAAAAYDAHDDDQIVVIAGILRGLLADRLIDKVTPLEQLRFSDTAERPEDGVHGPYGYGLTRIMVYVGWQRGGRIVAPLGGAYKGGPPPSVPFNDWWSRDKVIYPTNRQPLTREYVVYEMANTDGIHIDDELDEHYEALTRDNHGFKINGKPVTGNLASATVRQIAWETQHTLHRALPHLCGSRFPGKPESSAGHTYLRVHANEKKAETD
ncbi:hypothetical protein KN246_10300 [Mycobacterium intracellulare]|uniref:hypothetical protein n=1 Tax=Mycobacterium intracellulare TaxID=1767 RepID=UPI001E3CEE91|nr:hypothetical protein [Mycobacterium intracellulare]UGT98462.1 hypothetical protein LTQ55_07765 [Mycobacterium intracellulare]UQB99249.1 hypothetical protein KN246_10300 [Mycobacterium intracellulare]